LRIPKSAGKVPLAMRMVELLHGITRQSGVVLLYHSVADGPGNPYLGEVAFRRQAEMLRHEFRAVSADEFLWFLHREKPLPPRFVLVTFDDGYSNNLHVVQPIMSEFALPWVLFATTQGIEQPRSCLWMTYVRSICQFAPSDTIVFGDRTWQLSHQRTSTYKAMARWSSTQPTEVVERATNELVQQWGHVVPAEHLASFGSLLNAENLRKLAASPLVEVGAHTVAHPYLTQVTDSRLVAEIDGSKRVLEDVCGHSIRLFAYPSGRYGLREIARVREAGFQAAFAVVPQVGISGKFEVARVGIYSESVVTLKAKCLGAASMLRRVGIRVG
jgi:peptidoglycan/xylan/chitin deacetylase (PgdA/CDA1 family)